MSAPPKIHIWIPDYDSSMGGIQVFSRFLIRALRDCLPDAAISVLSKNDYSSPAMHLGPHSDFCCAGWWPPQMRTPAFACQLLAHTLRHRPDLVLSTHVNFSPAASWAKRLIRFSYAAVAHGVDVWSVPRRWLKPALRRADRVLAVSRFTRDRMVEEMQLQPAQVGVLPNTVDAEQFFPAPKPRYLLKRFGLKPDQPVILTVARLASEERYKGYDQVMRALPAIKCALPNVRYILGGRGRDRPRVEEMVRQLKLDGSVTLAGYIPDHELRDFYNLSDVFAMPSKREGFGIVFLEALACGKPVLAGNKDGSVDALLDGELGVLVDPDNVSEIGQALSAVLQQQHPLAILRQPEQLRTRVVEAFGYPRFVTYVAEHLAALGFPPDGSKSPCETNQ